MIEAGSDTALVEKHLHDMLVVREPRKNSLEYHQGSVSGQLAGSGQIDLGHAAFAQARDQLIPPERPQARLMTRKRRRFMKCCVHPISFSRQRRWEAFDCSADRRQQKVFLLMSESFSSNPSELQKRVRLD